MTFEQMLNNNIVRAQEPEKLRIDGEFYYGYLMNKEEFIKTFDKLGTLLLTDDEKYWVLYEERYLNTSFSEEIFWCIAKEEIDFIHFDEEWCLLIDTTIEDFVEDSWEESEEYRLNRENYYEDLMKYHMFETNFAQYLLLDKRADNDTFKVWQSIQEWVSTPKEEDIQNDNKACLVTYFEKNWNAWFNCILDRTYKYMNCTYIVWEAWKEV